MPKDDDALNGHGDVAVVLDGAADPAELGGKGAALDRLIGWGLPVPASAVVTASMYRKFAAAPPIVSLIERIGAGVEVGADEVDAVFDAVAIDPVDGRTISEVARAIAAGSMLAVRSSATVEDLDRSSFAGQYRSLLGVDPAETVQLESAVKQVFASLWHPAPCAYRRAFGIADEDVAMGVVLMRMVPAERAGVVFTVDPGGDPTLARIEQVAGLGEALVSGQETPEAFLLPRVEPRGSAPTELIEALDLSLRIEARAGRPQDVEWAFDGRSVWIVQARPITVVVGETGDGFDDNPDDLAQLDLTTAGIGEMLPGVLPPLIWGLGSHLVDHAFRRLLDDLGVLPADLRDGAGLVRRVRGRAAMDFSLLQGMAGAVPGSAPDELEEEYFGSRRSGRKAAPTTPGPHSRLRSVRHDLRVLGLRDRAASDAATAVRAVAGLAEALPDLAPFNRHELLTYHLRLIDLADRTMAAELGVAADAAATHRRLQIMLSRHLGEVEAGRRADQLVSHAGVTVTPPAASSAAVFAGPTWEELGRIPPTLQSDGTSDDEAAALAELLDALRATPGWRTDSVISILRQRSIRRLGHETTARLRLREQAKSALLRLGGEVRRVHGEMARRLVTDGVLAEEADVELLAPAELRRAVAGGSAVPIDVIVRRRRWRTRYAQDGPLPQRFRGVPEAVDVGSIDGDRVEGWAASPGRFRGTVQVVRSPDEVLDRDAVLVAEATDASWSPLFIEAGAIVLDRGGPLSHAAILARELGVPAVLNVPGATSVLAGREVTVDGDAGIVTVHDGAPVGSGTGS